MLSDILVLSAAVLAMLGSPGPAPLALAGVGAAFGPRRGAPFLFGILTAIIMVMALTAFGASALLAASPPLRVSAQALALCYIVYIAWRVSNAAAYDAAPAAKAPSFGDGFVLNILNPKAYAAFAAVFTAFPVEHASRFVSAAVTAGVSYLLVVAIDAAWLFAGAALRPLASDPVRGRWLRLSFAVMMVAAAAYGLARL
ncbi:MAG: LysE family translocator [Hyphococcus sp.]